MSAKRNTIQRQIILDTLRSFDIHPSVDILYAEIIKIHPTISKATVYRNLRQLAEEGEITHLAVTDDVARYDGNATPHYHFACKLCYKIIDLEMPCVEGINDIVQRNHGINVDKHEILFLGTCGECMLSVV